MNRGEVSRSLFIVELCYLDVTGRIPQKRIPLGVNPNIAVVL